MRVTLVYRGRYWVRQALELETLAAVLRLGGHQVRFVYDPDVFGASDNVFQSSRLSRLLGSTGAIVRQVQATRPEAVIFSVLPGNYAWSREVAEQLAVASAVPVVFIGLHATLVPEHIMQWPFVTATVQGEVENAINPLLEALAAQREPEDVGNLWYRRNGDLLKTAPAPLVDLDALPLPDKSLFEPHVTQRASYAAMVSRGCPYQCTFCEETCARRAHGGRYYRRKTVDSVMAELLEGKRRYRFREVTFKDSYLSGDHRWLAELMERFRREIRVPFKCFCTIASFNRETARLLKQGGCYSVEFGLQTWNDLIRREVLNRVETDRQAEEAFAACAAEKLWFDVDHMFNLPGETREDHIEGARRYRRLPYLNRVKVHHLVYLPTAPIVRAGQAAGLLPDDAAQQLADGLECDFYQSSLGGRPGHEHTAAYTVLYKLLPILPARVLDWLLQGKRVQMMERIPRPATALLQGLMALRSGDLRFLVYLTFYPAKVARAIAGRLLRGRPGRTQDLAGATPG